MDDVATEKGNSLHKATGLGQLDTVKCLVDEGHDINSKNKNAMIPLHLAAESGRIKILNYLVDKGADINIQDDNGQSPLHIAAREGHDFTAKQLFEKGADISIKDKAGMTPLHLAAEGAHIKIVEYLLDQEANTNIQDDNGRTPLHVAVKEGHDFTAKRLVIKGAEINIKDKNGMTPLHLVAGGARIKILKYLSSQEVTDISIQDHNGQTPLHIAASKGHDFTVECLVKKGADIKTKDQTGMTPLHLAARSGHVKILNYLVEQGTNINIQDNNGWTPLHVAAHKGRDYAVKCLVKKGADVSIKDKAGAPSIQILLSISSSCTVNWNSIAWQHLAAEGGRIKVVKHLVEQGADINMQDDNGWTPLHVTASKGRDFTVKCLVEKGADFSIKDKAGLTPLHFAAETGRIKILNYLLEQGADINIQDDHGRIPLHVAVRKDHDYTVKCLVKKGADISIRDKAGRTPMEEAAERGYMDIVHHLRDGNSDEVHDISIPEKGQITEERIDEEKHLAALEQAIREKGKVNKTIMQCAFVGTPRSGKSSLMKRLVGERPTPFYPSTGVADKVVQVIVRSSTTAANVSDSTWDKLSHDDEAIIVVRDASQSHRDHTASSKVPSHTSVAAPHSVRVQKSSVSVPQRQRKYHAEQSKSSPANTDVTDAKFAVDFCRSALSRNLQKAKRILEQGGWLVYLTDTGGQIEFQELLPLLVSGPTVFFLVFRLDHDLNKQFTVEYVRSTGTKSEPYQSTFTVKEALLQSLASIASMVTYVYRDGQKVLLKPQVFFVGTHKDMVSEAEIDHINRTLHKLVTTTDMYRKGIIQFASESRMLLVVNNLADDDSDIQLVRKAVERLRNRGDFNVIAPPSWLIFGLIIRQHEDRVLSYKKSFEIARQCGITDEEELKNALWFLHTKVGLIRHFQLKGLEDLQKIVIQDPQVLFDKVTDLVVETFTFEKADPVVWEHFKKKGIFPFSTLKRICGSSDDLLTPELLVKLLEHLHIIAPLQEETEERRYFMPCILVHVKPTEASQRICGRKLNEQCQNNPLLVCFRCGFCPKGLFAALVVYLLAKTKGDFQWRLQTDRIFKDQISFSVGSYDTISIAVKPKFFQITCHSSASSELSQNRQFPLAKTCRMVRHCIETGIREVTSALHYVSNATHYLAFYCTGVHQGPDSHPAEISFNANKLCTLWCELAEGEPFKLPPGYEQWFTEVSGRQQSTGETVKQTYEREMRYGHIVTSIAKVLLFGIAGSGKTSATAIMMGEDPPSVYSSTPLMVRSVHVITVLIEELMKWEKKTPEEVRKIIAEIIRSRESYSESRELQQTYSESRELPPTYSESQESRQTYSESRELRQTYSESQQKGSKSQRTYQLKRPLLKQVQQTEGQPLFLTQPKPKLEFDSVLESAMKEVDFLPLVQNCNPPSEPIVKQRWLYITDSGGQPEFHNMLSIFVQNTTACIFVFKMHEELDDCPPVAYYKSGNSLGPTCNSRMTNRQIFEQFIRTMRSFNSMKNEDTSLSIILLATHRDLVDVSKLPELLEERHKQLKAIVLPQFRDQLIYCDKQLEKFIFTMNAKHPEGRDRDTANEIRRVITEECPGREMKVPLRWHRLDHLSRKIPDDLGRKVKVLSRDEYGKIARKLSIDDDSCEGALEFFNSLNTISYFPKALPDLVFLEPQILLDLLTKFVEKKYLADQHNSVHAIKPKKCTFPFHDFAQVTEEFLNNFKEHYHPPLFTSKKLAQLFESLLIFGKLEDGVWFVPSILPFMKEEEVEQHRTSKERALVINFPNGGPQNGIFCSTVSFLLSTDNTSPSNWKVLKDSCGKPKCLKRNVISFTLSSISGKVTLIEEWTHFEVHVKTSAYCEEHLWKLVYKAVFDGLKKAAETHHYTCTGDIGPHPAIICPEQHTPTLHPATIDCKGRTWMWRCTESQEFGDQVPSETIPWLTFVQPQITQQPADQLDVVVGSPVEFTLIATTDFGTLTYQWQRNSTDLDPPPEGVSGETTRTLQIDSVKKSHEGIYRCIVSNKVGATPLKPVSTTTSNFAQLTVRVSGTQPQLVQQHLLQIQLAGASQQHTSPQFSQQVIELIENQQEERQSPGETDTVHSGATRPPSSKRPKICLSEDTTETPLILRNIDEILTEVLDWYTLGIKVGIPHHLLGEIQINYSAYGIGRQRQEMITKWLEYDTKASWDKLANALKEMGKHVIATKIWNTYVPGYTDGQRAPTEHVRFRERDRRINIAPVKHQHSNDSSREPRTVKQARIFSPTSMNIQHKHPAQSQLLRGSGNERGRERKGDTSAVSKSCDVQVAPPLPAHDSKKGQKRSPSGSPLSDDSLSPPPVKELDHISDLEIRQRTKKTAATSSPTSSLTPSIIYCRTGLERVDGTTMLGEDDLWEVRSAVAGLAERWKDLGISLGIRFSDLDAIHSSSPSGCLREMLAIWLKQSYKVEKFGMPTWRRLVEAVEDDVGGNNPALAQTIAREHPGSQ